MSANVVFTQIFIKIGNDDILFKYMFQNFHVELIPRATGNGYQNTHILILKKMSNCSLSVKHKQSSNVLLTSKK
jgi:hypothetical protein